MAKSGKRDYALMGRASAPTIVAPPLPYRPRDPKGYRPRIALIGCGGITESHLSAYSKAGYSVLALCDLLRERAEQRRRQFFPKAQVYTDYHDVLARNDIDVVDIATHPEQRLPIIRDALLAAKHVLSQKPFVVDLSAGRRLVELARRQKVKLAVNQNGRWAPYFAYMRQAIARGLIGRVISVHLSAHWDHNWIAGTPFEKVRHIILYDFAIHWFDALSTFITDRAPTRVYASFTRSPGQQARPALLGQALIEYPDAQATLVFDGDVRFGQEYRNFIAGTQGVLASGGRELGTQQVMLHTPRGIARPKLVGNWFNDGFHGTMAELLCAIEEDREPANSAENNLRSLELCFAAVAAAETGRPQVPGKIRRPPAVERADRADRADKADNG